MTKATAVISMPKPILRGVDGSFPILFRKAKKPTTAEKPGAQGDHGQGDDDQAEVRPQGAGDGYKNITDEHDDQAEADGLPVAEKPVGQETAEKREEIDPEHEDAVDEARGRGVEAVLGLQEQHEDADHGVEAEPLAHVGEEGDEESLGMSLEHGLASSNQGWRHDRPDVFPLTIIFRLGKVK